MRTFGIEAENENVPAPDFVNLSAMPRIPEDFHGLDPHFRAILDRALKQFHDRGYSFKFGIELDFELLKPATILEKSANRIKNRQYVGPTAVPSEKLARQLTEHSADEKFLQDAILKIRKFLRANGKEANRLANEVHNNVPAMRAHFEEFVKNLASEDEEIVHGARQNIFLAYLHLFPASEGGLRDVVEPRFGAYRHGIGWWDGHDDAEVRTNILENAEDVIAAYHRIRETFFATAVKFNLVPLASSIPAQLHVSLWKDGKNLMLGEDAESADICEKALHGYYLAIDDLTYFFQNLCPHQLCEKDGPSASGDRLALLRQLHDNWEIRKYGVTHDWNILRDIMLFTMGAGYGLFGTELLEEMKERLDVFIERKRKPSVKHLLRAPKSGLQSALEHSEISEGGTLVLAIDIAEYNHTRMLAEIGEENVGAFTVTDEKTDHVYDLNTPETWFHLFKLIHIDDAGNLDYRALPPQLQNAFGLLQGIGIRDVFQSNQLYVAASVPQYMDALEGSMPSSILDFYTSEAERADIKQTLKNIYEGYIQDTAQNHVDFQIAHLKKHIADEAAAEEKGEAYEAVDAQKRIHEIFSVNIAGPAQEIMTSVIRRGSQLCQKRQIKGGRDQAAEYTERDCQGLTAITGVLRPHFTAAVDVRIREAQADPTTGNRLLSDLHDLQQYLNNDAWNMATHSIKMYDSWLERLFKAVKDPKHGPDFIECVPDAAYYEVFNLYDLFRFNKTIPMSDIRKQLRELHANATEYFEKAKEKFAEDLSDKRCAYVFGKFVANYFKALDDNIDRAAKLLDAHEWEEYQRSHQQEAALLIL
ncbi:MAG: hypothetical protein GC136_06745 [Alphaproteobacteria bacterium]|nr:hypothetical protein [Alphaproteobacteria bacterium]